MRDAGTLIATGAEIKALSDNGEIGGYLVLFGDAERTDLSKMRDFFTPETDFRISDGTKSAVLYMHGMDGSLGLRELGTGSIKTDDTGVWIEAQLKLRDEYERKLFDAVKAKKMGWSSGTASHLVRRERQSNGAHKILSWPLGLDASITPTPAEPRTLVHAIKTLEEYTLELKMSGSPLGAYAHGAVMEGALERLDAIFRARAYDLCNASDRDASERLATLDTLAEHHHTLRRRILRALIESPQTGDAEAKSSMDEAFADIFRELRLGSHLALVRAAVARLSDRVRDYHELKTREGRAIPAERREQIAALRDGLDELLRSDVPRDLGDAKLWDSFLELDSRLAGII